MFNISQDVNERHNEWLREMIGQIHKLRRDDIPSLREDQVLTRRGQVLTRGGQVPTRRGQVLMRRGQFVYVKTLNKSSSKSVGANSVSPMRVSHSHLTPLENK